MKKTATSKDHQFRNFLSLNNSTKYLLIMPEDHRPHTASYLILQKQDEVLLMKRKDTGFKDGFYSLVSGHVDKGENFREAMVREAKEEVGINVDKEDLETANVIHRDSDQRTYVDIFFIADEWEGEPENLEPGKHGEISWFKKKNLPENTIDYVKYAIKDSGNGTNYNEWGWE